MKPLEPSSCAACLPGPNALMPACARSSTIPATSGVSGPTTTSSTAFVLQKSITAAWSATSSATHSASRAMPALPGAHQSLVTSGEAAIFQARACSRPPEPSRRMCMRWRSGCGRSPARLHGISRWTSARSMRICAVTFPPRRRDDLLQGRDMAGEGAAAGRARGHRGLRLLADKGLVDRDIAGLGQGLDMRAEIAVGGAGQLLQSGEFQPDRIRQRVQRRHDPQPQRLMDDVVEFGHHSPQRIQRPLRIRPPPFTTAIHNRNKPPPMKK